MRRGGGGAGGEERPALRREMPPVPRLLHRRLPRACISVLRCELSQGRVVFLNLSGFDQAFRPGAERLPPMTVSSKRLHFDTNAQF